MPRDTLVRKAIIACDEITGLITAVALVRPSRSLYDLEPSSVKKKWKDKAFAAGTSRTEMEHAAQEFGIAVCPWSPLAGGLLTGKYKREGSGARGDGRLMTEAGSLFQRFTERNWRILDVVLDVAKRMKKSPAQIALNWVATQPGVTSTIIGATKLSQLEDNLAAIEFEIPADLRTRLDEASAIEPVHPYLFFTEAMQSRITGGAQVQSWTPVRLTGADGKGTAELVTLDKAS
jgi:hypothetical protein